MGFGDIVFDNMAVMLDDLCQYLDDPRNRVTVKDFEKAHFMEMVAAYIKTMAYSNCLASDQDKVINVDFLHEAYKLVQEYIDEYLERNPGDSDCD